MAVALLWCNTGFSLSQQSAIDKYLSEKKLDTIEGIWLTHRGNLLAFYKSGSSYVGRALEQHEFLNPGTVVVTLMKSSNSLYMGNQTWPMVNNSNKVTHTRKFKMIYNVYGNSITLRFGDGAGGTRVFRRVWPENLNAYNSQFEKKKTTKKDEGKIQASSGTAFFVTNKGHLVTNYHVVEGCKNKSKIIYQDNEYNAKLLAKDKYLDLALLKSDLKNKNFIELSNKSPKKLQRIIAAGYPLGKELSDDLKFTSGIVSSLKGLEDDSTRIQIDAALNYGNSGGPIVDEKTGELIAVAVAGLDKQVTESINFGIKAGSVKNFLDSNQINLDLNPKKFNTGNIDLASILETATVYTYCK